MDFRVGDRVQSTIKDSPGLEEGEYGTVIKILNTGDAYIRWDEYNENRHDGYGDIPNGHGWFVGKRWLKHVPPGDLGELPENHNIKFLFGDDIYNKNM